LEPNEQMEDKQEVSHNESDLSYYSHLIEKANELKTSTDWQYGTMEFENLRLKWGEGPKVDDDQKRELYKSVAEAQDVFFQAKKEHYEKVNERRANNLVRREDLLGKLKAIVEGEKWSAFNEVSSIQRKFDDIKPLPPEAEAQNKQFAALMDTFNEHKVEYLVRVRQKEEENLFGKLAILDKLKSVTTKAGPQTTEWDALDNEVEVLANQWKKIGRVDKEKTDDLWEQYKTARDNYTAAKLEHNVKYRSELEKNLKMKTGLCEKAEELLEEKDLAIASKEMNILQKRWRNSGPVPRDQSEVIWERFKTAFDKFSEIRNANLDTIRDLEQKNYELKEGLCEKAEELAKSDGDDLSNRNTIEALFKEWNAIGPVSKRKTKKIWTRFKKAIDNLQKQRRNVFKQQRNEQKDNLAKKREIIEQLAALAGAEDHEEALIKVKDLQKSFADIGFVPIKQKDKIWKNYRDACDAFFNALRASGKSSGNEGSSGGQKPSSREVGTSANRNEYKQKQNELFRLKKECDKINDTILQYADTKTYIKPNKKGLVLIDEIQDKIDLAKVELNKKSEELESLRQELDKLGN